MICDGVGGSRSIMYTCFFTACAALMVSVCLCIIICIYCKATCTTVL